MVNTTKRDIEGEVKQIILDQLGVTVNSLDDTFDETLTCDELDKIEIIMALEEQFDIEIDDESGEKAKTVRQMVELVGKKIAK